MCMCLHVCVFDIIIRYPKKKDKKLLHHEALSENMWIVSDASPILREQGFIPCVCAGRV